MSSVIIAVVVVLGIIVAGGFLLYFLGDLLMSISGKKKDADVIRAKQLKQQKDLEARVNALENSQDAKNDPQIATVLFNGGTVEAYDPNEDEEEEETVVENETTEESVEENEVEDAAHEETEESEEEVDDTTEYIRQRRKELLERLAKMQEEREEEAEESEDTVNLAEVEDEETAQEETEESEETESEETEAVEEETETVEETEENIENSEEVVEEVEETETVEEAEEVEESEEKLEEKVAEEIMEEVKSEGKNALASNFTLEELESRLAEEQEKLKNNEKELRQCKKEFVPLRRVKNTLESDEKKLRRKEALVAKQKVVLYGVNNYADIDDEKAQKLAEDLDLLDGLKLSVQHCQEVMDKNQERYPLLERIFNLLTSQNEQIKEDIKNLQDAIASLKNENND